MKNQCAILFLILSLTGCGKGSWDASSVSLKSHLPTESGSSNSSTSNDASTPTPNGGADNGDSSECGKMSAEECELFNLINEYRFQSGLSVLGIHANCVALSQDHSFDMYDRNFFSHESPTETFAERVQRYELGGAWVSENIAFSSGESFDILNMWKNSNGHNANLLATSAKNMGVGKYNRYWTLCLTGLQ